MAQTTKKKTTKRKAAAKKAPAKKAPAKKAPAKKASAKTAAVAPVRRFLDAGVEFTEMTQSRAESIVKDLVKAGEVQAEQAQKFVDDLVARSRKNTDKLVEAVRKEVQNQVAHLGLATQDDIARIEKKIAAVSKSAAKTAKK